MTIETKTTINNLTDLTVSISTERFVEDERLGNPDTQRFQNSRQGRKELKHFLTERGLSCQLEAVMAVWGKKPLVPDEPVPCEAPSEETNSVVEVPPDKVVEAADPPEETEEING
jgi:hypothetical protein